CRTGGARADGAAVSPGRRRRPGGEGGVGVVAPCRAGGDAPGGPRRVRGEVHRRAQLPNADGDLRDRDRPRARLGLSSAVRACPFAWGDSSGFGGWTGPGLACPRGRASPARSRRRPIFTTEAWR